MSTPKKNRLRRKAARSIYVCPKTREPLYEHANGLVRDDGLHYDFIGGWNNTPIPDFLNPYALDGSAEESPPVHKQTGSIKAYRSFLDWLFQTFNENKTDFRRALIQQLSLKKGDRVLVTGAGTGDDIPAIIEIIGREGEVYAQDLSYEMSMAASECILPAYPEVKVCFSISNASQLPFADNFFDGAFHFGGINLFDNIPLAIGEMERVVKPGRRVAFGDEGVAPWLKETDYGRMAILNNPLWKTNAPLELLPRNVVDVTVSWVLGNCFYLVSFAVSEDGPFMNTDVLHKSPRGGSMKTRYFGQLEGVSEKSKKFVLEDSERLGISVYDWLEKAIRDKQKG